MRRHPELGARIMEPVPALAGARSIVIACHEHWDGSGYPLGLAGDDIPLGARIILACDAFHAMTSDRVYRQAMPVDAAIYGAARVRRPPLRAPYRGRARRGHRATGTRRRRALAGLGRVPLPLAVEVRQLLLELLVAGAVLGDRGVVLVRLGL